MRNVGEAVDRFALDPTEIAVTERALRSAGLRIAGLFHSHPGALAWPSEADRAGVWPELLQVILGRAARDAAEFTALAVCPAGSAGAPYLISIPRGLPEARRGTPPPTAPAAPGSIPINSTSKISVELGGIRPWSCDP